MQPASERPRPVPSPGNAEGGTYKRVENMNGYVYLVKLVKVENGAGGLRTVISCHYSEERAAAKARELNATEQERTPSSPWHFIVDTHRLLS